MYPQKTLFSRRKTLAAALAVVSLSAIAPVVSAGEDAAIEQLRQEVDELRDQLNATADALESRDQGDATHVGGYGELHYNQVDGGDDKLDFHRFVLFFGHDFNDSMRFQSELELEHAFSGEDGPGEVELEQAFVEFDLRDGLQARAGVFLMPVGIVNETHEPPTFYGVERNPVEKNIIPATWWEAGAGLSGQLGERGLSFDLAVTSGLAVDPATVSIRSGRQKAAKAVANDLALAGRLRFTGIPGLEWSASVVAQSDVSQQDNDGLDGATLVSTHAIWKRGPFALTGLYAAWNIEGTAARAANKDRQSGYYLEGAWKATPRVGLFARHNSWSVVDGVDRQQADLGVNFWPHPNVVLKADIQRQNDEAGNHDGFNLGIGYQF
ncbi:MAG TPA: porin [Gammaproteobacteria bacterium]|nr:porin [Gammaproteobacteria bacterium]